MLQTEFEERTGKRIAPQRYAEIERVYMAAEGIDKDTFCKEWKKLDGSRVVDALTHEVERLTIKTQNLTHDLEMENEIKSQRAEELSAVVLANKELAEEIECLRSVKTQLAEALVKGGQEEAAISIIGHSAVIGLKCAMGCELNADDRQFLIDTFHNK